MNDERRMTRDEGGKSQRDLEGLGGGSEGALSGIRKLDVMNKNEVIYC